MGLRGRETGKPAVRKPLNLTRVMPAEERGPATGTLISSGLS
jgi:hypothetical protein